MLRYIILGLVTMLSPFETNTLQIVASEFVFENAPFKACHASTLVELEEKKIMSAWFGGSNEGNKDVCIWASIKTDGKWSEPVRIADGIQTDGSRFPCWNPVLFKTKGNLLILHYKVGPNPREWWAMMKTSKDNGNTWSAPKKLPNGFLGPIKNKPLQLANGDILYPSSTESLDEKEWKIHLEKSDAAGKNFRKIEIDCGEFGVIQPTILQYKGGRLQLLCRSRQNVLVSSWSNDNGERWSTLQALALPNPNAGADAVSLKNGLQLLVYNPLPSGKNWWEGRSILKLAVSKNGMNWKDIYTLEQHESGEYSYPAIIQSTNANIHLSYTAERKNIKYWEIKFK